MVVLVVLPPQETDALHKLQIANLESSPTLKYSHIHVDDLFFDIANELTLLHVCEIQLLTRANHLHVAIMKLRMCISLSVTCILAQIS